MALSFLGFFFIYFLWDENKGESINSNNIWSNFNEGLGEIIHNKKVLFIGIIESIVACGFGLFLFGWTPILKSMTLEGDINVGFAFVCFVMSLITGATIFEVIVIKLRVKLYKSLLFGIVASIILFLTVVYTKSFLISLISLAFINGMIGYIVPLLSTIKSQIISDSHRSQIMCLFRVPLNLFLTMLFLLTNYLSTKQVFLISAFTQIIALGLCYYLKTEQDKQNKISFDILKDEYKKIQEESIN
jgi:hypothetical protein